MTFEPAGVKHWHGAAPDSCFSHLAIEVPGSHFKGHAMAGFGGAVKNISIGFGSGESGKGGARLQKLPADQH